MCRITVTEAGSILASTTLGLRKQAETLVIRMGKERIVENELLLKKQLSSAKVHCPVKATHREGTEKSQTNT